MASTLEPQSDTLPVIFLFTVLILIFLVLLADQIRSFLKIPLHERQQLHIQLELSSSSLSSNFAAQLRHFKLQVLPFFPLPRRLAKYVRVIREDEYKFAKYENISSWVCLLVAISSIFVMIAGVVIENGLSFHGSSLEWTQYFVQTNSSGITSTGIFLFVLSSNLFVISRQLIYYKKHKRQFAPSGLTRPPATPVSAISTHDNSSSRTMVTYHTFQISMLSILHILLLFVEFFQLLSFPLKDLFHNPLFKESHQDILDHLDLILKYVTLIPEYIATGVWAKVQFWGMFGIISLGICLGILLHWLKIRKKWDVRTYWVFTFIPLVSILYIPTLSNFITTAACLTPFFYVTSPSLQCRLTPQVDPTISIPLYLFFSLLGFIITYILFTVFLSSDERIPRLGEVSFRSGSVAFMKNMSLLLIISFLLIPAKKATVRGLISLVILITMTAYNINKRPCFVYQINYLRTTLLLIILYTSLLVTLLNDEKVLRPLGLEVVYIALGSGYAVILLTSISIWVWKKRTSPNLAFISTDITKEDNSSVDLSASLGENDGKEQVELNAIHRSSSLIIAHTKAKQPVKSPKKGRERDNSNSSIGLSTLSSDRQLQISESDDIGTSDSSRRSTRHRNPRSPKSSSDVDSNQMDITAESSSPILQRSPVTKSTSK
ncbi:hypothetical protein BKA69DRAFT_1037784 [Paraphysoderma sedebokerense]|nr:hypothetical protein BKA69DRAFT_1037784 [Paraphysoderma sedebokerense]